MAKRRTKTAKTPAKRARKTAAKRKSRTRAVAAGKTKSAVAANINYIPNDPLAIANAPMRGIAPHAAQAGKVARFSFASPAPKVAAYQPGTAQFLYYQTREAALVALDTFAWCAGPLAAWAAPVGASLKLIPNAGQQLNAYYDRKSVSFFMSTGGGQTTYSGASTDVVAHECGHAMLDSLRPDLWDSALPEHGAFHEAFGDCIAILTALNDDQIRRTLLARPKGVDGANFVESTAEDLSDAVRRTIGPTHPAALPRHALNTFQWKLPSSLPASGGPTVLTGEVHSFARVFTGCFYDTIRKIFAANAAKTSAGLGAAARTAGHLLIEGVQTAIERPRFFEEVGNAMLLADQGTNAGANISSIRAAFAQHSITLSLPDHAFRERSLIAGAHRESRRRSYADSTSPGAHGAVKAALRRRLSAGAVGPMTHVAMALGDEQADKFVQRREVSLSGVSPELRGVMAEAPQPVVVGFRAGYAAARSALPEAETTEEEVRFFAETLLEHGSISGTKQSATKKGAMAIGPVGETKPKQAIPTHVVRSSGNKRMLRRIGFTCGCNGGHG